MALWNKGEPRVTGDYIILLEGGETIHAHFFRCQMSGQMEWSRPDGSYIYETIIGWMDDDGK